MTSVAVLLAPLTVGTLADATSLTAALAVVPVTLAAAGCCYVVTRAPRRAGCGHSMRSKPPASTGSSRPVRQPRTASRTSGVGRSR